MKINPFFACFLLFFLMMIFPLIVPISFAQKSDKENVPMAYRATQALRYSEHRGLATNQMLLPVSINSTIIKKHQPLRLQSNHEPFELKITDSQGNEVFGKSINQKQVSIKTDKFSTGIYDVHIILNEKKYTYKVSIE